MNVTNHKKFCLINMNYYLLIYWVEEIVNESTTR